MRVLLVEDEPGYARYLREVLIEARGQDYEVTHAVAASDAVLRLRDATFDVVLLDLGLPDADGTEALEMVSAVAAKTPIVVLSALADVDLAVESMRLGAQEYVVKGQGEPFLLPRAIRYAIERRRHLEVLAEARREAERANAVKDEFLAMLGHELRNPLAPIVTALGLIRARGHGDLDRELSIVERQIQHVVRLVDDLLDVARITRGKLALDEKDLDLADVVRAGAEAVSPLVAARRHALEIDVPTGALLVRGDPSRLTQVVTNLLTNAAKYTPAGGAIRVVGAREGDAVELGVRDTGVGMSPELLARVFELFEQGERTIDRAAGGLGLGLPIVRNLVTLHGGSVTATSEGPGRGTEVVVRLPFRAPTTSRDQRNTAVHVTPTSAPVRRILIVDDNADGAELLQVALGEQGHVTATANDGATALATAAEFRPDIVLLDIGLPVIDGYEVARRLREAFAPNPPKLVAITGFGTREDRAKALAAGFDLHLVKPVELAHLRDILASGRSSA